MKGQRRAGAVAPLVVCLEEIDSNDRSRCHVHPGGRLSGETVVEHASSLPDFLTAIAWDVQALSPPEVVPVIRAQASELDSATLGRLRQRFDEGIETRSWPCRATHRFFRGDQAIELWACPGQCDWLIVAGSLGSLENLVRDVV